MTTESSYPDSPICSRRRRRRRVVLVLASVVGLVTVVIALVVPFSLLRNIETLNVDLNALPDRPAREQAAGAAVNIVVLGTSRGRCISLMIFHIDSDRERASFVSVPDSGICGAAGRALEPGDAQRVAGEVEQRTRVRLDHVAVLDWRAIEQLDDVAGGVQLTLDRAAEVPYPNNYPTVHGNEVADFVDTPVRSTSDDLARMRRQQLIMKEVLRATLHQEMRKNPVQLYNFLDIVTVNLALDSGWSERALGSLAVSLRSMRSYNISYHTGPPSTGGGDPGIWQAIRMDQVGAE